MEFGEPRGSAVTTQTKLEGKESDGEAEREADDEQVWIYGPTPERQRTASVSSGPSKLP